MCMRWLERGKFLGVEAKGEKRDPVISTPAPSALDGVPEYSEFDRLRTMSGAIIEYHLGKVTRRAGDFNHVAVSTARAGAA